MTTERWPIIDPGVTNRKLILARKTQHSCPGWMRISSADRGARGGAVVSSAPEPDPAKVAADAAALAARQAEAQARKDTEAAERRRIADERKEAERKARSEASERHKAEMKAAKAAAKKTPEQLAASRKAAGEKIRAKWAAKRAAGLLPPKKAKEPRAKKVPGVPQLYKVNEDHVAPEGYIVTYRAAREVGCSVSALAAAIGRGALPCIRKGRYTYITIADAKAYRERAKEHQREAAAKASKARHEQAMARLAPREMPKAILIKKAKEPSYEL
jgi:hypothetical protein